MGTKDIISVKISMFALSDLKCSFSYRVCVFEDTAEVLDPLSTVQELIHFLDRLCTVGLTLENNHSLLLHFTLNFTEWVKVIK